MLGVPAQQHRSDRRVIHSVQEPHRNIDGSIRKFAGTDQFSCQECAIPARACDRMTGLAHATHVKPEIVIVEVETGAEPVEHNLEIICPVGLVVAISRCRTPTCTTQIWAQHSVAVVREWPDQLMTCPPVLWETVDEHDRQPIGRSGAGGFTTYIASGGDRDFMRPITHEIYGIPSERVIGGSNGLRYHEDEIGGSVVYQSEMDVFDDGPIRASRPTYESRRVHVELTHGMDIAVSENLVAELMRYTGIVGLLGPAKVKRLRGVATADDSAHRKFHRLSSNELWFDDTIEHCTDWIPAVVATLAG